MIEIEGGYADQYRFKPVYIRWFWAQKPEFLNSKNELFLG